jgi:hypothetical protein
MVLSIHEKERFGEGEGRARFRVGQARGDGEIGKADEDRCGNEYFGFLQLRKGERMGGGSLYPVPANPPCGIG